MEVQWGTAYARTFMAQLKSIRRAGSLLVLWEIKGVQYIFSKWARLGISFLGSFLIQNKSFAKVQLEMIKVEGVDQRVRSVPVRRARLASAPTRRARARRGRWGRKKNASRRLPVLISTINM